MEKSIYNIGKLRYFLTIIFGKNRQVVKETIEEKDKNGDVQTESYPKDYLITISKKAVIVTVPNPINNMRIPYIVKRLKFVGKKEKAEFYIDNEGYNWVYTKDHIGELVSYYKDDSKIIHLEI